MRTTIRPIFVFLLLFVGLTSCGSLHSRMVSDGPTDLWLYDSILFEIAPITSTTKPNKTALDIFRDRLHTNRICKRNKIKFLVHRPPPLPQGLPPFWNSHFLALYEEVTRKIQVVDITNRNLVVYVPYIDGLWLENGPPKVLGGIQYHPTAFVIFKSGAGSREAGVLLHEFGHMIGLVKDSTRANHDDYHQHHCANKYCAMFWTAPGADSDYDYYCKRYIRRQIALRNQ